MNELTLLDWKRRVFELYAEIRADPRPERAWVQWRDVRDELFRSHPQSPAPGALPHYFEYDPALRVHGTTEPTERIRRKIATSGAEGRERARSSNRGRRTRAVRAVTPGA